MLSETAAQNPIDTTQSSTPADWNGDLTEVRTSAPGVMSDLVANKRFTPMPQPVLSYVCLHDRLSEGAKVLWFHLYRQASQWDNWTVRRGVPSLARELGVAERTIQRRLAELDDNDLLVRGPRFIESRQLVNDLRVTLPFEIADLIQKREPDRRVPATRHPHRQRPAQPDNAHHKRGGDSPAPAPSHTRAPSKDSAYPSAGNAERARQACGQSVDNSNQPDSSVTPRVTAPSPRNNNNDNDSLEERQHAQASEKDRTAGGALKPLQSFIASLKSRPVQVGHDACVQDPPVKAMIMSKLARMGFQGQQRQQLADEVVFSVTHGQWESPAPKAVNACLKLIRQNRWRTPKGYRPR